MSFRMGVSRTGPNPFTPSPWRITAEQWATETGATVRTALKNEAPVGKGPEAGRLRDSIRYARRISEGSVALEFSASAPYTPFVLDGTPPHMIRARAARYLHWVDAGGHDRFAKQVNHPGTQPNQFPRRALMPLLPVIQRRFEQIAEENLRR